jgi:hypothetical protein
VLVVKKSGIRDLQTSIRSRGALSMEKKDTGMREMRA